MCHWKLNQTKKIQNTNRLAFSVLIDIFYASKITGIFMFSGAEYGQWDI